MEKEFNIEYKNKEGKVIKGNINPQLFKLKRGEVLYVEEIF